MKQDQLIEQILGTFIPDEPPKKSGTVAWAQQECRSGRLMAAVKKFCEAQPEPLDYKKVLVDGVTTDELLCRIPTKLSDHENPSAFRVDVEFKLNPSTGKATRA